LSDRLVLSHMGPVTSPSQSPDSAIAPTIHAHGLKLSLGSGDSAVEILRGIDLVVPRGQTLALLGPSGSGKSSLMAVLSGLERAGAGSLTVAGQDFARLDEDALARARRGRIGVVLQAFHLLPTMTALENVTTPLELAGMANPRARAEAELTAVGLGHRMTHYPAQLSGGEQQRVAIARAIAPRPALIFADEPTGNLDSRTGAEILSFMRRAVREMGQTIVMVTHDPVAASYADRALFLADGRIVDDMANPSADMVLDRIKQLGQPAPTRQDRS